jgi:hypothetical protein
MRLEQPMPDTNAISWGGRPIADERAIHRLQHAVVATARAPDRLELALEVLGLEDRQIRTHV